MAPASGTEVDGEDGGMCLRSPECVCAPGWTIDLVGNASILIGNKIYYIFAYTLRLIIPADCYLGQTKTVRKESAVPILV
jgi:hypothetical protein